jgi:hypothetical protein
MAIKRFTDQLLVILEKTWIIKALEVAPDHIPYTFINWLEE